VAAFEYLWLFPSTLITGDPDMKIRALIIAAALSSGAAFAAAPNDTAKAPADTDAKPAMSKPTAKEHNKMAKKHHEMHHAMKNHHESTASSAPSVDLNDQARQSRMEDALANYHKQRS
jgi:Spy/CpxP family protein refolding chaperone